MVDTVWPPASGPKHGGENGGETQRRHIALVIFSLGAGGAERVISLIANYWAAQGWLVDLITLTDIGEDAFFKLHPDINHWPLGVAGTSLSPWAALMNNWRRWWALRRLFQQLQVRAVIAFQDEVGVLSVLAALGLSLSIIVAIRNDPVLAPLNAAWHLLRRWCYPRAAGVVVQTSRMVEFFPPSLRPRIWVIPNPVTIPTEEAPRADESESARLAARGMGERTVLAMGRLTDQKGFDLLIEAFAEIAPRFPQWSLCIWGEGPARPQLTEQIERSGLSRRIHLPGQTSQPFREMRHADLFILSSRYEGFPNVLCEAMACGLPVISFDCRTGPREIIRDGIDGLLVPGGDRAGLAKAMAGLMADSAWRQRLASRAPEVLERFELHRIMAEWEAVIANVSEAIEIRST